MKKILVISTLMLSMATFVNAQETDNREVFQIGGRAGLTYSNVYNASGNQFDADGKLGFTAAAFFMVPVGKYFGIQPELMVTQKGFKGTGTLLFPYSFKRTTTFLEVPVMFAFKPSEFITLLAGPQYSFLLKQTDRFTSSEFSYLQEQEFKQDNVRNHLFGAAVGLEINLRHVVLGARIGWDMVSNRSNSNSGTPKYNNVSSQFTIGYKIY